MMRVAARDCAARASLETSGQGHGESPRMVAIEFGTCRSGRIGGASGSITRGKGNRRELRGGRRRGGNPGPFGDQEAIGGDAQTGMVVEAAPAAALEVPEPKLLLEVLVVALDAPP